MSVTVAAPAPRRRATVPAAPAREVRLVVADAAGCWDILDLVDAVVGADLVEVFGYGQSDAFVVQLRASVTENMTLLRDHLAGTRDAFVVIVGEPVSFGVAQADLGMSQTSLQRSYRVGTTAAWRHWVDHLRAVAPPELFAEAVVWSTQLVWSWFDRVMTQVARGFADREEDLRRSGRQMRQLVVRQLLDDTYEYGAQDAFLSLRYDISLEHLAVIVSGVDDDAAETLASSVRGGFPHDLSSLTVRISSAATAIWWGKAARWTDEEQRRIVRGVQVTGVVAAIGESASGRDGFRATYEDAVETQHLRDAWSDAPHVLWAHDLRMERLLLNDLDGARRFVMRELGALGVDGRGAEQMRATLLASLTSGSHVETAATLGVHEHTVRNRLHRLESLLGEGFTDRRVELLAALRLHRLLEV